MIRQTRELVARIASVNREIARTGLSLVDGEVPAEMVHQLGRRLVELGQELQRWRDPDAAGEG
ncbi:hypothetical protein [Gandjariella thermophila]|uniref:Uncharacterized protein n=1 Tax=Gandjariella thermophila TaxID=1931992 RepID=A0A4D4JB84_9PSEU|nr:hypothetical protein [Gandjariella thermophila]GDY31217.1 hypothetical protein GTS_28500 [Gandjariella thermophila]